MASIIQSVLNSVRNKYQNIRSKMEDDEGFFRQGKFTPITNISGHSAAENIQKAGGWGKVLTQMSPLSMKEAVVPSVMGTAEGIRRLTGGDPNKIFKTAQDVGYGLRGALNITPFGGLGTTTLVNKISPGTIKTYEPTTERQQKAQDIGQALYGTMLTAPLGGGNIAKNIASRAIKGTIIGTGMKAGSNILSGEKWNKELDKGAIGGLENSWKLAITDSVTDALLGKLAPSLTSSSLDESGKLLKEMVKLNSPEVKKAFMSNAVKLFARALAEVPAENTLFVAIDKLNEKEKRNFFEAWANELPSTIIGNLAFATLQVGKRGVWDLNKNHIDAAKNSLVSAFKNTFDGSLESQSGKIDFGAEIGGPKTKTVKTKGGLILNQEIEPKGDILPTQDKIVNSRGSGEVTEPNLLDKTTKSILGEQPKIEQPTKLDTEPLKDFSGKKIPTKQSQEIKQRVKELDSLNPVEKLVAALKKAKSVSPEQQKLTAAGRKKQYARISQARASVGGEKGYFAQLGAAKGEFDKVEFESLRNSLKQSDIDSLFNSVKDSQLSFWEKLNAGTGLEKLLGKKGGKLPTKGEIKLLDEVFGNEFTEALLSKRSLMMKLTDNMKDAINIPRALMASVDLSAPFRQGIFLVGHPKEFFSSFGSMIKSFGSEKAYNETLDNITQRPTYQLMRENKLAITRPDSKLSQGEESFMSNFAKKIPGVGTLVKASDRAYSGFLNKLRADVFDELFYKAKDLEIDTSGKVVEDIANFVNTATGRGQFMGPLKGLNKNAEIINGIFFSPKLMASRLNLLNPVYYAKLDPFVRKEAIKSLLTFAGTALTTVSLASLAGADVEKDPRSADFGKIKIGNTRYDTWGGFQQYIRLAAQFITGQTKSTGSGEIKTLGEGYKARTRWDIGSEFLQNKEAPVASFVTSLLKGQDNFGNKFNLPTEVLDRLIPMYIQDTYDLIKEWGPKGALMSVPGMLGVGSQTYGTQIPHMETNASGKPVVKFKNVGSMSEDIVSKLTGKPESNISPEQQKEYLKAREQEQKTLSFKNKVKKGEEKIDDTNFDDFYSYTKDGVVKFVDVGKFDSMPEQTAYQRALKEQKKFTLVDDILDNLKPEEQARALSALGISPDDALYYNIAKQNNMMKSIYVEEEIRNLAGAGKSKDEIMEQLANWRIAINGKIILSNSVIDDLVDNKIISYQDGKLLKKIKEDGSFKQSGGSSAKKGKKISVSAPKITPIKAEYKPIKLQVSQKKVAKKSPQKLRVKLNFTTPKTLL